MDIDVHGAKQPRVFFYVIEGQSDDMILGDRWMVAVDARYSLKKGYMDITCPETKERLRCWNRAMPGIGPQGVSITKISKITAQGLVSASKDKHIKITSVTMADIEKALRPKLALTREKLL